MTTGRSRQAAARLLGLPPGRCAASSYRVQRWARDTSNSPRLHAALDALAADLDAASNLTDYRQRRHALAAWSIPADDWHQLLADVKQRQRGRVRAWTDWSDHKRLVASVLVWTRITQGEHRLAPLLADQWPPHRRRELARTLQRTSSWGRTGRPQHHYVALLAALDAYADQLATRIDTGWTPPPQNSATSANLGCDNPPHSVANSGSPPDQHSPRRLRLGVTDPRRPIGANYHSAGPTKVCRHSQPFPQPAETA